MGINICCFVKREQNGEVDEETSHKPFTPMMTTTVSWPTEQNLTGENLVRQLSVTDLPAMQELEKVTKKVMRIKMVNQQIAISAGERVLLYETWNSLNERLKRTAITRAFGEILSKSAQIRAAFDVEEMLRENLSKKNQTLSKHIDRLMNFLDKTFSLLTSGDDKEIILFWKQIGLQHATVKKPAWSSENFEIFNSSIIKCVLEQIDLTPTNGHKLYQIWQCLLGAAVQTMRISLFKAHNAQRTAVTKWLKMGKRQATVDVIPMEKIENNKNMRKSV